MTIDQSNLMSQNQKNESQRYNTNPKMQVSPKRPFSPKIDVHTAPVNTRVPTAGLASPARDNSSVSISDQSLE